ncbi:hypothetical protein IAR55_003427 [Kwoniella newhampshirensis]|uniref:Copper-fist domain-containing protein n=1 Tax=Kwoniella newhampshirensis TaxID=1651941 RepID=A0AAW0Z1C5_9TREE
MVFINDKKFACEKCIKGHRVSGCTHTDRPLFEVKKKGRPATQCQHCKDKRKLSGGSVHTKCACSDPVALSVTGFPTDTAVSERSVTPSLTEDTEVEVETRKGQPGSRATFPRGLKDVHELSAAADSLAGQERDDGVVKVAERKVEALLNPCRCQTGGPCKCCHPKKSDGERDPYSASTSDAGQVVSAMGMFADKHRSEPTASPETAATGDCCSSKSGTSDIFPTPRPVNLHVQTAHTYLSPDNMHHPAHTSPHVHKTKLYSPYTTSGPSSSRHVRREPSVGTKSSGWTTPRSLRPVPPKIRPITDIGRLFSAAVGQDGNLASEIPRSALGLPKLPGIQTFDTAAENGGVKVESMQIEDVDMPLAFPTDEDVIIGACVCGEDCPCPGCVTHDNGVPSPDHTHDGSCGEACKGHQDCSNSIPIPSGITSIAQLISLASSNIPPPPEPTRMTTLDPFDTRILPPAAQLNGDADAKTEDDFREAAYVATASCCSGKPATADEIAAPAGPATQKMTISTQLDVTGISSDVTPSSSSTTSSRQPSPLPKGRSTPIVATANPSLRRTTSTSSKHSAAEHPYLPGPNGRRATVTGPSSAVSVKSTSKPIAPKPILPKPVTKSNDHMSTSELSGPPRHQSPVERAASMSTGSGVPKIASSDSESHVSSSVEKQPSHADINLRAILQHTTDTPSDLQQILGPTQPEVFAHLLHEDRAIPSISLSGTESRQDLSDDNPELTAFVQRWPFSNPQTIIDPSHNWSFPGVQAPMPTESTDFTDPSFDLDQYISQALSERSHVSDQQCQPQLSSEANEGAPPPIDYASSLSNVFITSDHEAQTGMSLFGMTPSNQSSVPTTSLESAAERRDPPLDLGGPGIHQADDIFWWLGQTAGGPTLGSASDAQKYAAIESRSSASGPAAHTTMPAPDIIDLSQPLDAAAMAKILKALERQQAKAVEQQTQMVPLPIHDRDRNPPIYQPVPTETQSLFVHEQQLEPSPSLRTDIMGSAKDLDDMFNQFVTLDGVGQSGGNGIESAFDPTQNIAGIEGWLASMGTGTNGAESGGQWDPTRSWNG